MDRFLTHPVLASTGPNLLHAGIYKDRSALNDYLGQLCCLKLDTYYRDKTPHCNSKIITIGTLNHPHGNSFRFRDFRRAPLFLEKEREISGSETYDELSGSCKHSCRHVLRARPNLHNFRASKSGDQGPFLLETVDPQILMHDSKFVKRSVVN